MMEEEIEELQPIDDKASREMIVSELEDNFFVEASAGSGKTTSLVYRMVALIEKDVPVNKICTITFTKAAADEFFNRFQALLSKRSVLIPDESDDHIGPKTEETIKRCQRALENIDSCFLGTIDAFCNMIAHELPSELGIPSDSKVVDMDEYLSIVQDFDLLILKDENHPLHKKALQFKDLIYRSDEGLAVGIKAFLEMRHTKIVYDKDLINVEIEEYFKENKLELLNIIQVLLKARDCYNPKKNGEKNDKYKLQANLKSYNRILLKKNWKDALTTLKFALMTILKMDGFNKNAIDQDIGGYLQIPDKVNANSSLKYTELFKERIEKIQNKLNEYTYSVFCDYVEEFSKELEKQFKELGKFQFFDFLYYLNEAFKKSEKGDRELINHILERHAYFLLDESQDTNPLQTELFFHLTGTVVDDDWKKVQPKEGSLFIVGDPKQSIYSFRDANVSAYLDNKQIFANDGEVLILTRNFRSNVRLRQWFNHAMNSLLYHGQEALEHKDIPISDEEIEEEQIPGDVIDGVYKYCVDKKDEADYIAKMILSLVGKEKIYTKNEDKTEGAPRKKERLIRFSDFMIVPRSTDASKIVASLNKYHIPLTIEAQIPFSSCESLMVIKDLVYLLKSPQKVDKLLNVLYGPLYKLDEKDVISYVNSGFDLNIANPIEVEDEELNEVIKELNDLYKETFGMSFSSTMLYILNNKKLNIFEKISSSHLEYTYFLIQKVKEKEEDSSLTTVHELESFIDNFLVGKDDQRSLRFKDKLDRVKLSNVHKVKGLQAPIVILVKSSKEDKTPTKYVDFNYLVPRTYFSKIMMQDGFNDVVFAETKAFENQLPIWEASERAERERLEYVAATRAESVLIVGSYTKINSNEYAPWGDLCDKVDDNFNNGNLNVNNEEPPEVDPIDVPLGDFNINIDCYNQTFKYVSPSQLRINRVNNNTDDIDDSEFLDDEKEKQATVLGTLVHRLMELIVSSKNQYDIDSVVLKVKSEYGADDFEYEELLRNVALTIKKGGYTQKNSSLDDDILKTLMSAKKVWCETPFSYLSKEGNIVHGIIDVMYLDQNDKYHVIDYKTNEEDDVSILEKEYEKQLTSYRCALKKMGVDCDAHIYHIDLNKK